MLKTPDSVTLSRRVKKTIEDTFETAPSFKDYLLAPSRYGKFCELLHSRMVQLELAGYVRSESAAFAFIDDATRFFAEKQLDRIEGRSKYDSETGQLHR
jgi:hypothetical protein